MKFATLRNGTRDGRLVVVSKNLAWCADATHIAPTMQAALDDWAAAAPKLQLLAQDLEHEAIRWCQSNANSSPQGAGIPMRDGFSS